VREFQARGVHWAYRGAVRASDGLQTRAASLSATPTPLPEHRVLTAFWGKVHIDCAVLCKYAL